MDIFAHGLWSGILFNKNKKIFWPIFFGVAPDIFSFGIYLLIFVLTNGSLPFASSFSPQQINIPRYTDLLYNFTHSLIIFAIVFAIIWIWRRKPCWPVAAWGVHILFDIPLHNGEFFPTPFLFPISGFKVSLISWAEPVVIIVNYSLLLASYLIIFWRRKKENQNYDNS